ncbi:hypothetical protein AB4259_11690 [Vibrio amylolyticus]|uniref:hypothetical protein n=1 Tax=Vibrio amylolyticus TaxID=2847292 RepID=UPI00355393BA
MTRPPSSFTEALLKSNNIRHERVLNLVEEIYLSEGLIAQGDIDTQSEQYRWLHDVVIVNMISMGLLEQIILEHSGTDDDSRTINIIVRDIATRLMSNPTPFPCRR